MSDDEGRRGRRRMDLPASALDGAAPQRRRKRRHENAPVATGAIDPNDATRTLVTFERPSSTPPAPERPARKLVVKVAPVKVGASSSSSGSDSKSKNIWYDRTPGARSVRSRASTRCVIGRDSGTTKATPSSYYCLHFAHGSCTAGYDCVFKHGIPTDKDDEQLELTKDIFGRDRHDTDRQDMGGIGSFSRHNTTLYVNGIIMPSKELGWTKYQQTIVSQFKEWGHLKSIRILPMKMCVFITYYLRASAEFAREAMRDQNLGQGEWLNVRWATADSNPAVVADDQNKRQALLYDSLVDEQYRQHQRLAELTTLEGFPAYTPTSTPADEWPSYHDDHIHDQINAPNHHDTATADTPSVALSSSLSSVTPPTPTTTMRAVRNRDDSHQHLPTSLLPLTALPGATTTAVASSTISSSWPIWKPVASDPQSVATAAAAAGGGHDLNNDNATSARHSNGDGHRPHGVPVPASFNANDIIIPSVAIASEDRALSSLPSATSTAAAPVLPTMHMYSSLAHRLRTIATPAPPIGSGTSALAGLSAYDSDDE